MERMVKLVDVLGKLGEELSGVTLFISDIQDEMKNHVALLREELADFQENAFNELLNKDLDPEKTVDDYLEEEKEMKVRLWCLKNEINGMEGKTRVKKEEAFNDHNLQTNSSKNSSLDDRVSNSPFSNKASRDNDLRILSVPLPEPWWMEPKYGDEETAVVDWTAEHAQREDLKMCLMAREGWRKQNESYEELEETLRRWTGMCIKWTPGRKGRATKHNKIMMVVRFENTEDRKKVYDMRKLIVEEGYLEVGEALSFFERKERWKMLMTAERLKAAGRTVEFENKRICVDGQWWAYVWTQGWKKLGATL